MIKYTFIRTVWIFIILAIILTINFVILKLAPEFPPTTEDARNIFYARQVTDGYMTVRVEKDPVIIDEIEDDESALCASTKTWCKAEEDSQGNAQYRIYEPIPVGIQFGRYIKNIVTDWNWGYSTRIAVNTPVFDILKQRIPITMRLNLIALVFYIPIGFTLGIIAALFKDRLADNIISLGVMIFISIPSFVVMTMLVMWFAYSLGWFPTQFPADNVVGLNSLKGIFLPVLGLSFLAIAGLTRLTRAELTEVLTSEFLLLARTKGLTKTQAVIRHALRNSMVPLVPSIIFSFVGLLSGSIVIEKIYGIPGTGRVYLNALVPGSYDYNVLLAVTAFYTTIGLFAVLLVDLSYGLVDPRIRMGAKK
ncbi:MAG: ABC transporter permease [Candidatus Izimaplasma sp.]|nr:ABC transporter permease [Candidatus Izimaplasma bacterium]